MGYIDFISRALCPSALSVACCLALFPGLKSAAQAEVAQHQNVVLSSTRTATVNSQGSTTRLSSKKELKSPALPYRGWVYLAEKLRRVGVSESEIRSVYENSRMPEFSFVSFKLQPREHNAIYNGFRKESTLEIGRKFLEQHKKAFAEAEHVFKVNRYIIAAILLIETHAGQATGNELVINRLSRLASIAEPDNLAKNYENLSQDDASVSLHQVQQRAQYLEETFYPEVLALFELKRKQGVDILALRGSGAGAFGLPQFLPSSFLKFAVDANKDGKTSLFHSWDAIWSAANYLSHFGWQNNAPIAVKRNVLWKYNHSDAYIDAALDVADRLK